MPNFLDSELNLFLQWLFLTLIYCIFIHGLYSERWTKQTPYTFPFSALMWCMLLRTNLTKRTDTILTHTHSPMNIPKVAPHPIIVLVVTIANIQVITVSVVALHQTIAWSIALQTPDTPTRWTKICKPTGASTRREWTVVWLAESITKVSQSHINFGICLSVSVCMSVTLSYFSPSLLYTVSIIYFIKLEYPESLVKTTVKFNIIDFNATFGPYVWISLYLYF